MTAQKQLILRYLTTTPDRKANWFDKEFLKRIQLYDLEESITRHNARALADRVLYDQRFHESIETKLL